MKNELIFSGVGGQGIMLIGKILCTVSAEKGYNVTFAPTYGQEKRGGRTSCQMVISDTVESPVISEAGLVLVMDESSLVDFEDRVKEGSYLIINSSMIEKESTKKDINIIKIPINDIAREIENTRSANFVALGVALKYIDILSFEDINNYIERTFEDNVAESNKVAFARGYNYGKI